MDSEHSQLQIISNILSAENTTQLHSKPDVIEEEEVYRHCTLYPVYCGKNQRLKLIYLNGLPIDFEM